MSAWGKRLARLDERRIDVRLGKEHVDEKVAPTGRTAEAVGVFGLILTRLQADRMIARAALARELTKVAKADPSEREALVADSHRRARASAESFRLADARRVNDGEGWSFTVGWPPHNRRSYEGHRLSEDELRFAMRLAQRSLREPLQADRLV